MKRVFFLLIFVALLLPAALLAMQDAPSVNLELTSASAADFPTVILTANVFDTLGQPLLGLTEQNFAIVGELADRTRIVRVENIADDNLPFSVVLVIDTSSSMDGRPLEQAKAAATEFINLIGPNDPVAIVTFDTQERVVQDFTTDKDVLINTINNLSFGGQTALYDGALLGIQKAADDGLSRRAVILLSDGAEFGGRSGALRDAASAEARSRGVPVYTIGLGFGVDRTYLQELAEGTLTQFYESPTPDELTAIYNELAAKFRSQYIITLEIDVPADGITYNLELQVNTDQGTDTVSGQFRAPVPVPIIKLPEFPGEIAVPTDITAEVAADEAITSAEFLVDGSSVTTPTEAPYTITVDPALLSPGIHELTFNVTDSSGDAVSAIGEFTVAALPSTVTILGIDDTPIVETLTVLLDVTGQTPAVSATYTIDDGEGINVSEVPFSFTIDPTTLAPGAHTLRVAVLNEGGVTTNAEALFTVASLLPVVTVEGIESGQEIAESVDVTVSVTGQTPVTNLTIRLAGEEVFNAPDSVATFTIDPAALQAGDNSLEITAVTESGEVSQILDFKVAALPPSNITISGLDVGATLEENVLVSVDATTQSPLTDVIFTIDGVEVAALTESPFEAELDVLELGPGPHILAVEAVNAGGTAVADVAFIVSDGPSLTATALVPTSTPTPTNTPQATNTPVPTINRTATAEAVALAADQAATQTADAQIVQIMTEQAVSAADAQSTQDALATSNAEGTANAAATGNARATANALATANAAATGNARATANADATNQAGAAQSAANVQATSDAGATADAQTTLDAQASLAAQSALDAQSTLDAQATGTQAVLDATQTQSAEMTLTAESAASEPTEEASAEVTAVVVSTESVTEVAQAVASPTAGDEENQTPSPTLTTVPLTSETQGAADAGNNILPVLCIIVALVVLVVLGFLVLGRQRRENNAR